MSAAHAELDLRSPQLKAKPRRRINKVEEENRQNLLKLFIFIMVLITALTNLPFYAGKVFKIKKRPLVAKWLVRNRPRIFKNLIVNLEIEASILNMSSELIIWCKSFGFFGFFDIIALVSNASLRMIESL